MAQKPKAKRRGRPPMAPEKRKRPSMGFRPTAELRAKLEEAAASSGLSMTQEVERRLERSLGEEAATYEIFGGKANFRHMRLLGGIIHEVELLTKKTWVADSNTKHMVRDMADSFFRQIGVKIDPDTGGGLLDIAPARRRAADSALKDFVDRAFDKHAPKPRKKVRKGAKT